MSEAEQKSQERFEVVQAHVRSYLQALSGLSDTSGMELLGLMRLVLNVCEGLVAQQLGEDELSGPRWALLLHLLAEEQRGQQAGVTPTSLSRFQRVHKNTISALLRGLEEQGLVQRTLDAQDRRRFRIQLTPAGRERVRASAPLRIQCLNRLVAGLSPEEQAQLTALLGKLYRSLLPAASSCHRSSEGG